MSEKLEQKLIDQRKRQRRNWGIVAAILVVLFLAAVAAGFLAYWWTGGSLAKSRPTIPRGEEAEHFIDPPNKMNIVIMGVDSRPQDDDPGRSDTHLVMTIDTVSREISIMSVPRDTRVRIQDLGWDKINHAFSVGGSALSRQTTENFLGIPIDYYATVSMESFTRIIDAIGGVTIDVEKRMQYEDTWEHFVIDLKPGLQHMDGKTALQYVRYRDEEGDIGRVGRQHKFVKAVLAEVNTPSIILKAPSIIREVFSALDTNIPMPVMLGLARKMKDGLAGGLKANMVEGLPYYISDISYWVPDVMKTRQKVAEMQGVPFTGTVLAAAQRLADEYRQNLPANAHLDDGTYYYGMDSVKQVKPKTPPAPAATAITPAVSPQTTTPPKTTPSNNPPVPPNKDALPPKK